MSNILPTDYQSFIHKSRYAKYFDIGGRESWTTQYPDTWTTLLNL